MSDLFPFFLFIFFLLSFCECCELCCVVCVDDSQVPTFLLEGWEREAREDIYLFLGWTLFGLY